MRRLLITLLFYLSISFCIGQEIPYYNRMLGKYYSPLKVDFSKEYLELQTKRHINFQDQLQQSLNYDFSSIWLTNDDQQNGIIGFNYQRIQIHISKVSKDINTPDTYFVKGKSKVNNNICDFSGEIKLIRLLYVNYKGAEVEYDLFATYLFYEDSTQNESGVFKGTMECAVHLDSTKTKMILDEFMVGADGYWNRTFVGTWTNYKTNDSKKCIWGDYRLPFTFDFDCGDGELMVCDKYVNNGWKTFNGGLEYIIVGNERELKDKWWIKK